jgi:hypothetical protein
VARFALACLGTVRAEGEKPIPATDLAKAFAADAKAAKAKYDGKTVQVEGKVIEAGTKDLITSVLLEGAPRKGGGTLRVRCLFPFTEADAVKKLKAGQTVKVEGVRTAPILDTAKELEVATCKFLE